MIIRYLVTKDDYAHTPVIVTTVFSDAVAISKRINSMGEPEDHIIELPSI